jgi:licheninase
MVGEQTRSRRTGLAVPGVAICLVGAVMWTVTATVNRSDAQGNCPRTAANALGWGTPLRAFDFGDTDSLNAWWLYDGPGHAGNGRRTPAAITVAGGLVTITGDERGASGGMAPKGPGQKYGRWEVCAKSPLSAPAYHSVLLLWPDAEDWPVGGEIDFMEIADPQRQHVQTWLHSGADDQRQGTVVPIDATQWHTWGVEWTPDRIVAYVDGAQWWESTDAARFPPRPMHLCMQLDNFGGDTRGGAQQTVDWAREYRLSE